MNYCEDGHKIRYEYVETGELNGIVEVWIYRACAHCDFYEFVTEIKMTGGEWDRMESEE